MAYLALGLLLAFGVLCLGLRSWMHVRQTGASPFLGGTINGVVALIGFVGPFALAIAADLRHAVPRLLFVHPTWAVLGTALAVAGIVVTLWSQLAMGASWRIGIDNDEHTALVTTGPYERVRNPIYTGMFAFDVGTALVLPNAFSLAGAALVVAVISVVVRRVEEPYLLKEHGLAFVQWKGTTGRFLPRLSPAA